MTEHPQDQRKDARRKFFTIIPNLIDDLDLSPVAIRLYLHLRRVAGEHGRCWESSRRLAQKCRVGRSTISRAKKELRTAGLIQIGKRRALGGQVHEIAIVDLWQKNEVHYGRSRPDPPVTVKPDGASMGHSPDPPIGSGSKMGSPIRVSGSPTNRVEGGSVPGQVRIKTLKIQKEPELQEKPGKEGKLPEAQRQPDEVLFSLRSYFLERSKLPPPKVRTGRERREAAALWHNPLREIAQLVDWCEQDGMDLIDAALERATGLTVYSPKSILKIATAITAEVKRGSYRRQEEAKSHRNLRNFLRKENLHGL